MTHFVEYMSWEVMNFSLAFVTHFFTTVDFQSISIFLVAKLGPVLTFPSKAERGRKRRNMGAVGTAEVHDLGTNKSPPTPNSFPKHTD
jgi:hypothetical protein